MKRKTETNPKGAGRKSREELGRPPKASITIKVEPHIANAFRQLCKYHDRTQPEQFERWVRNKQP